MNDKPPATIRRDIRMITRATASLHEEIDFVTKRLQQSAHMLHELILSDGVGVTVDRDGFVIRHGGSGIVCPTCYGSEVIPEKEALTLEQVFGAEKIPETPCPTCSVPAGPMEDCETCQGEGMRGWFDTDKMAFCDAICDDCKGRGKRRKLIAFGVVFDPEFFSEEKK